MKTFGRTDTTLLSKQHLQTDKQGIYSVHFIYIYIYI